MDHAALLRDTQKLEIELGPCLCLVKCYELLGDRSQEARRMAQFVLRGELERLGQIIDRGFGFSQRSEQFLRAIYALSLAGKKPHAESTLKRFLVDARNQYRQYGVLSGLDAFRVAIAQVVSGSTSDDVCDILAPDSLGARLTVGWFSDSRLLQHLSDDLDELIEAAENMGSASLSSDGWLYVLQLRISVRLSEGAGDSSV